MGAVMYHLAEAYHARQSNIEEKPAPCEIGGFVRQMDPRFGSVVANAGGMQVVHQSKRRYGTQSTKFSGRPWALFGLHGLVGIAGSGHLMA